MKNALFIAFTGLVMASCNDRSEKAMTPAASVQPADTSSKTLALVPAKDSIKNSPVRPKVRTKKVRASNKVTATRKTSATKKS
jgi:hypothetical protein